MKGLGDISLQFKIILTVLFLTIAVSGLSIAVFIGNDLSQTRKINNLVNDIINEITLVSSEMSANNFESAYQNLNTWKSQTDDVKTAEIYIFTGKALIKYPPELYKKDSINSIIQKKSMLSFLDKNLELLYPVKKDGKTIGAIYILTQNLNVYLYGLIEVVILIAMMAVFVAMYLGEYITEPLAQLVSAIQTVSENDYSVRIKKVSQDEIGTLADSFNHMLEKIQINNEILVKTSKLTGMAEVSASIMHNVGNVLNSINVSSKVLQERVRSFKVNELNSLLNLLKEHQSELGSFFTEDEKGMRVIAYLDKWTDFMTSEQQSILKEIEFLNKNVEHIKGVIASQQSMIKTKRIIGQFLLSEVFQDILAIHKDMIEKHHIHVAIENRIKFPVLINRTNVEQILINFVHNSIDALAQSKEEERLITINSWLDEAKDTIFIRISDNGVGIAAKNLSSIFEFGYTTKKEGHGFGLHGCILAAKEMNGTIEASSEGLNKGASFTLSFPRGSVLKNLPSGVKDES